MAVWHAYCDETCKEKPNKLLAVGVTLVPASESSIGQSINNWRIDRDMHGEMKWTKVSKKKYPRYCEFAMDRIADIHQGRMYFSALYTPLSAIDHKAFNDGSEERGIRKLIYQLILHRCIPAMAKGDRLVVFPDQSQETVDPKELRQCLNLAIKRKYNCQRNWVTKVDAICSKTTNMGQVNDVFLGAVGWHANDKDTRTDASWAKCTLANDIASALGRTRLSEPTPPQHLRFAVWDFHFNSTRGPSLE